MPVATHTGTSADRAVLSPELLSRCLQHERDHLDGVLFVDRVSPLKRKMLLKKWARQDEAARARP